MKFSNFVQQSLYFGWIIRRPRRTYPADGGASASSQKIARRSAHER